MGTHCQVWEWGLMHLGLGRREGHCTQAQAGKVPDDRTHFCLVGTPKKGIRSHPPQTGVGMTPSYCFQGHGLCPGRCTESEGLTNPALFNRTGDSFPLLPPPPARHTNRPREVRKWGGSRKNFSCGKKASLFLPEDYLRCGKGKTQ